MSSQPTFDITGEDHDQLEALLPLLMVSYGKPIKVTHWQTFGSGELRLAVNPQGVDWTPFPQGLTPETLGGFMRGYLQAADYGRPDHDGDGTNVKAWQLRSGGFTHACSVAPTWIYYGK